MISFIAVGVAISTTFALLQVVVNRLAVPRITPARPPENPPLVSVVIPARNEERSIRTTVAAFLEQDWPEIEVLVVDDRSVDATRAILEEFDDPRLTVIEGASLPEGWLGKPWALQQGGLRARGEWLLFCDADVRWSERAISSVMAEVLEEDLEAVTVLPHLVTSGFWEKTLLVNLIFTLWTLFPLWKRRDTSPQFALGGGPGNLIRTSLWREIGTHAALHNAVIDDIGLMRRVRKSGRPTSVIRADHLVDIRMYEGLRELIHGFSKNAWYAMGASFFGSVIVVTFTFVFNLLPYLILVATLPSLLRGEGGSLTAAASLWAVAAITVARLVILLPGGYGFWNALLAHPLMMGGWLFILIRSAMVTGLSKKLTWRGRDFDTDVATPFGNAYDAPYVRGTPD